MFAQPNYVRTVVASSPPNDPLWLNNTLYGLLAAQSPHGPHHRAITVSDDTDPAPAITLVSITSNESEARHDHGDRCGDIQDAAIGTDDRSFRLRAERDAHDGQRIYTVVYRATDSSGNTSEVAAQVVVPRDRSQRRDRD